MSILPRPAVVAHVSDTHFDTGERSDFRGRRVMSYLNSLPGTLDAILVTGDITDHGLPAEWEHAAQVLTSAVPVHTCPGNHDGYTAYDGPLNRAADVAGIRVLLADSVIQGRDDGLLADTTLEWLAAQVNAATGPVLIAMHHPPVDLHQPLIDAIQLGNADQLAKIAAHKNVLGVLCGHAHTPAASLFAGKPLLVAPGVISTLLLPWEVAGEPHFRTAIDRGLPPAIAFHVIGTDGRITTHFRVIPD